MRLKMKDLLVTTLAMAANSEDCPARTKKDDDDGCPAKTKKDDDGCPAKTKWDGHQTPPVRVEEASAAARGLEAHRQELRRRLTGLEA